MSSAATSRRPSPAPPDRAVDTFVRRFLQGSLASLGLGVTLGLAMAIEPRWVVYRPAHAHLNVLGFVTFMIYGVAYHVIPRFTGRVLHSRRLAWVHLWSSVAGLGGMVAGFLLLPSGAGIGRMVLATGGLLSAVGAYAFIYNVGRTLGAASAPVALSAGKPMR